MELILYRERKVQIIDNNFNIEELMDGKLLMGISYNKKIQTSKQLASNERSMEKIDKLMVYNRWLKRKIKKVDEISEILLDEREKGMVEITYMNRLPSETIEYKYELTYHAIRLVKIRILEKLNKYFVQIESYEKYV